MLLCGNQASTCYKQPLLWGIICHIAPKKIPCDFNPKLEFDSPWKSINGCSKSNVASFSIDMLITLAQKSWGKKENPNHRDIEIRTSTTTIT